MANAEDFDGWKCRCGRWCDRDEPCHWCHPEATQCGVCREWYDPDEDDHNCPKAERQPRPIAQPRRLMCCHCNNGSPESGATIPGHSCEAEHAAGRCACAHPRPGLPVRQLREGIDDYPPVAGARTPQQQGLRTAMNYRQSGRTKRW
jgi:hypothetical protein